MTPKELETFLYDLAGEKKIQGRFIGKKFIVESDVDKFVEFLDESYNDWEEKQKYGIGKM